MFELVRLTLSFLLCRFDLLRIVCGVDCLVVALLLRRFGSQGCVDQVVALKSVQAGVMTWWYLLWPPCPQRFGCHVGSHVGFRAVALALQSAVAVR
jgi:hypothetical protein